MRPDPRQLVDELGDGVGDADPDRRDVEQVDARLGLGVSARIAASRIFSGVEPGHRIGRQPGEALVGSDGAREAPPGLVGECPEQPRDVLERLALEQPGEQEVALLPQGELVVEVERCRARQQPAGLELDERGGDQQELGGDVEVEGAVDQRSISTR